MRHRKPTVESLESRRLLSVSGAALTFPLTQGATWTTEDDDGYTDTYVVAGPTTFNAHSVTKIQDTGHSVGNPDDFESIYVGTDANKNFGTYGDISVTTNPASNPDDPPITTTLTQTPNPLLVDFPATMVGGKAQSFTALLHGDAESSDGSSTVADTTINETITLVSETKQSVTVPAGTFMCYEIHVTEVFTEGTKSLTANTTEWIAPGFYPVKEVSSFGASTPTTTVLTNAGPKKTPTKLEFDVPPSDGTTNKAIEPAVTVDVEDINGTIVGSDTSTVTLTVLHGPSQGVISGVFSVDAVDGVATFSNIKFNKPGTYTLIAKDGSLTSATSRTFVINAPDATKLAFGVQPPTAFTGDKLTPSVTVLVENADDTVNADDTSNVTLSIASGPLGGKLGGTVTVAAVAGVATFSDLTLSVAGIYTLKASDGSLTAAISIPFGISAKAKAAMLAFDTPPANAVAGKAIAPAVTVDVEYATGPIVLSDKSTVVLSVLSGPGVLTGTTSVAAVNGVATFSNLLLTKAGTYTLQATDGTLTAAKSKTFTITAGVASKLVIGTQPAASTAAGKPIAPAVVVDVEDAFGNIVTTNTSTVAMSIATGGGSLTGTTSVAAKAGVATFSNLTISKIGAYTIKATDAALAAATSNSFKIVAGVAAKLAIVKQPPASTVAGKVLGSAVVVDVTDAFGNLVTTNTSNVTLSVLSGGGAFAGTATVAAKAGVATFSNLILTKAGAHTLKAADGSLAAATSGSFKITPAAATKLAFAAALPASVIAGKAIAPAAVVDVEDTYGNIVTTSAANVTVSLGTGPTGGTLSAVMVAAKAGVATFSNLILTKAGSYTLKAVSPGLTSATSSSVKITPAAAKKLVITGQPKPGHLNTALSPAVKVSVEDIYGNVVTTDKSKVTIAIATGPAGALTGTLAVSAVNGVATFSALKLSKAGTYTLKVTDGILTTATSTTFAIT